MILLEVVGQVVLVVGAMLAVSMVGIVGPESLQRGICIWREQLRETLPYLLGLGAVLALNKVARDYGPALSWVLDWNVTSLIYRTEGTTVAWIQSFSSPTLTTVLGFAYIYGYTFLLIFPFVAYFLLDDERFFKRTAIAYGANYVIGVACYTLFVSYGPRNLLPDLVTPLLYTEYPRSKMLTTHVNTNTNVFPSLHTSLSVTVAALAWQSREAYPRWPYVAVPLVTAVVVSTTYLGIHWVVDVVAGVTLGLGSVALATRWVD
ncbi:MAG: phosphatase PAP2 family protein [Halobacteriota archaeon]